MENDNPLISASDKGMALLRVVRAIISKHWHPKPIDPPQPDPALKDMNGPQRSAETIRYTIQSLEFWLSKKNQLREWVRLNSKLSAVLLVPALLVVPVIILIFGQIAEWLVILVGIAEYLIVFPVVGLIAVAAITGVILLLRYIFGR